jgi:hypothetical protein
MFQSYYFNVLNYAQLCTKNKPLKITLSKMYQYCRIRLEAAMDSGGLTSAYATELISSNGNVSGLYWAGGPT